jgi:hypothetical protein
MLEDINNIRNDIQEYIEVRLGLIRLHTAENLSKILSSAVNIAVIGYMLFFILLFISFAAGYFLGSRFDSTELGFLCVAGFYLVILLLFLVFRKQIIERPIIKAIVKLLFPKFSDDEKAQ